MGGGRAGGATSSAWLILGKCTLQSGCSVPREPGARTGQELGPAREEPALGKQPRKSHPRGGPDRSLAAPFQHLTQNPHRGRPDLTPQGLSASPLSLSLCLQPHWPCCSAKLQSCPARALLWAPAGAAASGPVPLPRLCLRLPRHLTFSLCITSPKWPARKVRSCLPCHRPFLLTLTSRGHLLPLTIAQIAERTPDRSPFSHGLLLLQ